MTIQEIIQPHQIETELLHIWEKLAKEKTRASLFNLIVFSRLSKRTDYFRNIVQKVVEKFPCRILFISEDPDAKEPYLKTAVSVVIPKAGDNLGIACDLIDIGVAGSYLQRVPFLLFPHLVPDLPIYLLWAEDPSIPHPLFSSLSQLATRIIFDSEAADDLLRFSKTLLDLRKTRSIDLGDMNWARTEGWRDLIASTFHSQERQAMLKDLSLVKIIYNAQETEFFCHLKIQALYLLSWLSSRLNWKFQNVTPSLHFQFESLDARIESETWEKLGPGTVIAIEFHTSKKEHFTAKRIKEQYHHVKICLSSEDKCELPYPFILGQTATGQSLVKEICTKGTSIHYLEMLKEIQTLDQEKIC